MLRRRRGRESEIGSLGELMQSDPHHSSHIVHKDLCRSRFFLGKQRPACSLAHTPLLDPCERKRKAPAPPRPPMVAETNTRQVVPMPNTNVMPMAPLYAHFLPEKRRYLQLYDDQLFHVGQWDSNPGRILNPWVQQDGLAGYSDRRVTSPLGFSLNLCWPYFCFFPSAVFCMAGSNFNYLLPPGG